MHVYSEEVCTKEKAEEKAHTVPTCHTARGSVGSGGALSQVTLEEMTPDLTPIFLMYMETPDGDRAETSLTSTFSECSQAKAVNKKAFVRPCVVGINCVNER